MTDNLRVIVFNAGDSLRKLLADWNPKDYGTQNASLEFIMEDKENTEISIKELYNMAISRNSEYKLGNSNLAIDMSPVLCIFNNFSEIKNMVNKEAYFDVDAMFKNAGDFWNIMFVVTDSCNGVTNYNYTSWYAEKIMNNCIWTGNGVKDFKRMINVIDDKNLTDKLPQYSGYRFRNGRYRLVKLIAPTESEGGGEDE